MAVNFKVSDKFFIDTEDDPMHREWVGYDPTMTPDEIFERNRGIWNLKTDRVEGENYATFSHNGTIVSVAEIDGVEVLPWAQPDGRRDKKAVTGRALHPGHPVYDYFVGRQIGSDRNPVTYIADPEPREPTGPAYCACGCGTEVSESKTFAQGHDQKAVHSRIAEGWGDTVGFIKWFDSEYRKAA